METAGSRVSVIIIGGGFSGGAIAYHLARLPFIRAGEVVVFEPRPRLGAGLAYDTADPAHRINVPATRMSLLADVPEDFSAWIERTDAVKDDPGVHAADGSLFPQRRTFGAYVSAAIQPDIDSGRIVHRQTAVVAVEAAAAGGWRVTGADGTAIAADMVVIATSHPSPDAPAALRQVLDGHPRFVADPTVPGALDCIRADDRVLVVGNGLTSADVIASLTLRGHRGPVTAISRRGLRSRGHAAVAQEPFGEFAGAPQQTALQLLKRARAAIRDAQVLGISWHAVLDALRMQGQEIWKTLPVAERRRLVRHLRPFWDVHRFRIAPQVEAVILDALASGRLHSFAASLGTVRRDGDVIVVDLRTRGGRPPPRTEFDAVVVTTGPGHGGILKSQPWIADLAERGVLTTDPAHLGLDCNRDSQALDRNGRAVPSLYIAGPLARGTFGELMGLPQVTEHAAFVAAEVAAQLQPRQRHSTVG